MFWQDTVKKYTFILVTGLQVWTSDKNKPYIFLRRYYSPLLQSSFQKVNSKITLSTCLKSWSDFLYEQSHKTWKKTQYFQKIRRLTSRRSAAWRCCCVNESPPVCICWYYAAYEELLAVYRNYQEQRAITGVGITSSQVESSTRVYSNLSWEQIRGL